jgi:membrane protein DedA with SNARE-associated domain
MTHFVEHYGLWVVFSIVILEVGGLPFVPGETALIAAAVLASQGHGSIVWTIVVAIAAAVLGAGAGYVVGRRWGRDLLSLWPWLERVSRPAVRRSETFFDRHGSKAVFIGRFLPLLRATLGWMAGVAAMSWQRFAVWNVLGAIAWGVAVGLAAYYAGAAVIDTIQHDATIGIAILVILAVALAGVHVVRGRLERS